MVMYVTKLKWLRMPVTRIRYVPKGGNDFDE